MKKHEEARREIFKEILINAFRTGTEEEYTDINSFLEELKEQLSNMMIQNK